MNLYVTTSEIKSFMGISGSSQDTKLDMLNKAATSLLNGYLGVSDLALHKVTDEVHDACSNKFRLHDIHVTAIGSVMDGDTEYTQDEAFDIEARTNGIDYVLNLEDPIVEGYRKGKFTYAAGWNASGMAKITVTVSGLAAGATITLGAISADGFTLTRGSSWTAQSTDALEATAIAAAIDAQTGTRAFALGNVVYIIEATNPQVATRTIATSDSTRLALSDSILRSVDFPEAIRFALLTNISSMFQLSKNPRLKSYTVGQKTVTFASKAEADSYEQYLKPFVRGKVFIA